MSLGKNSFTLLETLFSIVLLAIVISGFSKSTYYDKTSHNLYTLLNHLENKFDTNQYKNLPFTQQNLKIIIDKTQTTYLQVKKYEYKDEKLKVFRYEK